jgi:hypothetical protein
VPGDGQAAGRRLLHRLLILRWPDRGRRRSRLPLRRRRRRSPARPGALLPAAPLDGCLINPGTQSGRPTTAAPPTPITQARSSVVILVYPLLFQHTTLHAITRQSTILRQKKTAPKDANQPRRTPRPLYYGAVLFMHYDGMPNTTCLRHAWPLCRAKMLWYQASHQSKRRLARHSVALPESASDSADYRPRPDLRWSPAEFCLCAWRYRQKI